MIAGVNALLGVSSLGSGSIEYVGVLTDDSNSPTYSQAIAATPGCSMHVLAVHVEHPAAGSPLNVVSATWNGATLTPLVLLNGVGVGAIYATPDASSGTFTVNLDYDAARFALGVWGLSGLVPDSSTGSEHDGGGGVGLSTTVNVAAGGAVVAAYTASSESVSDTFTWSSGVATGDYNIRIPAEALTQAAGGHTSPQSEAQPSLVVATSHAAGVQPSALVVATFRPA